MEGNHQQYIQNERNKQDQENDKYYKFYKNFNQKMEDRQREYEDYIDPIKRKEKEAQLQAERDLEMRQQAEDAKRRALEEEKRHQ